MVANPDLPTWVKASLSDQVATALTEDMGDGDITAELVNAQAHASATLITREAAVLCGIAWFDEVFCQLGGQVSTHWHYSDGDRIEANSSLCTLEGNARQLLSGERTAMNFLQTLSGTATTTAYHASLLTGSRTRLLDTRKTLPGLRTAQKYAVLCGGGSNHRQGLFDAFLIKENHIATCGSIQAAVDRARQLYPDRLIEVEVENLTELDEALLSGCQRIMLDNFSLEDMQRAVAKAAGKAELEVSGNVSPETLAAIARTGVEYVSVGALTKHVRAVDLSLRVEFV